MPSLNDTLRLLANEQRRGLVRSLSDGPHQVTGKTDGHAERVQLHHLHLPKLTEADVVEFHPTTEVAERGPAFDEVRSVLEAIDAVTERATDKQE